MYGKVKNQFVVKVYRSYKVYRNHMYGKVGLPVRTFYCSTWLQVRTKLTSMVNRKVVTRLGYVTLRYVPNFMYNKTGNIIDFVDSTYVWEATNA